MQDNSHDDDPQSYIDSRLFWERDINGSIALVNTAKNKVKTILIAPSRVQDDIATESKIAAITLFIEQFGILKDNSWEMLDEKIQGRLDKWFDSIKNKNDVVNIQLLEEGFKLSRELQKILADERVKDITPKKYYVFPFGYYSKLEEKVNGRRTAESTI